MSKRINTAKWLPKYNRWQINVQKGGERRTFYCSTPGRKGQIECNKKADSWLEDNLINQNMKVSEFVKIYNEHKNDYLGTSKKENNKSLFKKHILPVLKNKKVSKLTEYDLQKVLDKMYRKGYSYKYIDVCRKLLQDLIKFARQNNLTKLYIEELKVNKKAPIGKKVSLQPGDIRKMFHSDKTILFNKEVKDMFIYAYRFTLVCGLRRGEVIGLMWSDIIRDIKGNSTLYINRSINEYKEITNGKTKNAQREIPLNEVQLKILEQQKDMLNSMGIKSKYIFCNRNGEIIEPNSLTRRYQVYCKHNGIEVTTYHELRHSFISIMKNDLDLSSLKSIVGHSENMETLAIYGHNINGELEIASKKINNKLLEIIG